MAGLLESLSMGLRSAGGIMDEGVYKGQRQEELVMQQLQEKRKDFMAQQVIDAMKSGSMPTNVGTQTLEQLGFKGLPVGPSLEAQKVQLAARKEEVKQSYLARPEVQQLIESGNLTPVYRGMMGLGIMDPLDAAKAMKDGTKPIVSRPGSQILRETSNGVEVMHTTPSEIKPTLTDIAGAQPGVKQKAFVHPDGTVTHIGGPAFPDELNPDVQANRMARARAGASRTNVNVNPMRETFKDEQDLRKEYVAASGTFQKLGEGYSKVKGALAADATKSAPATLAAATQFMKMLDPDSVVRESELGMALAASGVWDRFTNLYQTVQSGRVLTPTQSKEFGRIADVVYDAANRQQNARVQHFRGLAKSYNFNPDRVVPDLAPKRQPTGAGNIREQADAILGRR